MPTGARAAAGERAPSAAASSLPSAARASTVRASLKKAGSTPSPERADVSTYAQQPSRCASREASSTSTCRSPARSALLPTRMSAISGRACARVGQPLRKLVVRGAVSQREDNHTSHCAAIVAARHGSEAVLAGLRARERQNGGEVKAKEKERDRRREEKEKHNILMAQCRGDISLILQSASARARSHRVPDLQLDNGRGAATCLISGQRNSS